MNIWPINERAMRKGGSGPRGFSRPAAAAWLLLIMWLVVPLRAAAEEPGDAPPPDRPGDIYTVPGVTVEAPPASSGEMVLEVEGVHEPSHGPELDTMSGPVVMTRDEHADINMSLKEILEATPGVEVYEMGGDEGPWMVSIRGNPGSGAAVYLDGILLNDALGRTPDLSGLPAAMVDEVRVYRGATPSGYASSNSAGVIDIKTRPASQTTSWQGKASYDSLSAGEASAVVTGRALTGSGMAGVSYQGGPDKFRYEDDRGTYSNEQDDRERDRNNNDFSDYDVMLKWDRKASGFRIYTGAYYQQRHHDLSGQGWQEPDNAASKTELVMGYAGLKRTGVVLPDLDLEVRIHALQERDAITDRDGELGPARDENNLRTRLGADLYLRYYGFRDNRLKLYVGLYNEEYRSESEIDPKVEKIAASRASLYFTFSDEISLLGGRLKIEPRLHYIYEGNTYTGQTLLAQSGLADDTDSSSHTNTEVSAGFMIVPGLWFLAHTGQRYRTAGMLEEFGDRVNLLGNPALSPERLLYEEAAMVYDPGRLFIFDSFRAELAFYNNHLYNRIGWVDAGGGVLAAENLGDARIRGVELAIKLNVRDLLFIDAAYAWQEAINSSDNKQFNDNGFPGVPGNTASLIATLHRPYGRIYYKGYYQDVRYLDEANQVMAEPRVIHDLGIAYYRGKWSFGFEAKNIGNNQSREVLDYPLPGTSYLIFMEVEG